MCSASNNDCSKLCRHLFHEVNTEYGEDPRKKKRTTRGRSCCPGKNFHRIVDFICRTTPPYRTPLSNSAAHLATNNKLHLSTGCYSRNKTSTDGTGSPRLQAGHVAADPQNRCRYYFKRQWERLILAARSRNARFCKRQQNCTENSGDNGVTGIAGRCRNLMENLYRFQTRAT